MNVKPVVHLFESCAHFVSVSSFNYRVVSPRADDVGEVGARVEEEVVAPLLVTDVQGGAVDIDPGKWNR